MPVDDWQAVAVIMGLNFLLVTWPLWAYLWMCPRKHKRSPWRIL